MQKTKIFGIDILSGSREELFSAVANMIGEGGAVSTVNPEILYDSLKNEDLRAALSNSLCIPDGVGVERSIRRRGIFTERFPGVELGEALLSVFAVRLGIIGGKDGVAKRAMKNLQSKYPSVIPAFTISGYNINNEEFGKRLAETKPDVVFVCLGSPLQEIFINEMRKCAKETLFIALGGSVDIYAGDKRRAPRFIRQLRCEWLYRILREPQRIKRAPKLLLFALKSRKNSLFLKNVGKIGKKT